MSAAGALLCDEPNQDGGGRGLGDDEPAQQLPCRVHGPCPLRPEAKPSSSPALRSQSLQSGNKADTILSARGMVRERSEQGR